MQDDRIEQLYIIVAEGVGALALHIEHTERRLTQDQGKRHFGASAGETGVRQVEMVRVARDVVDESHLAMVGAPARDPLRLYDDEFALDQLPPGGAGGAEEAQAARDTLII